MHILHADMSVELVILLYVGLMISILKNHPLYYDKYRCMKSISVFKLLICSQMRVPLYLL